MRIRSALFHDAGSSAHAASLHSPCPSCSLARFAPLVAAIARARVTSETPTRARVASGAHRERSRAGSRRAPRRGLPTPAGFGAGAASLSHSGIAGPRRGRRVTHFVRARSRVLRASAAPSSIWGRTAKRFAAGALARVPAGARSRAARARIPCSARWRGVRGERFRAGSLRATRRRLPSPVLLLLGERPAPPPSPRSSRPLAQFEPNPMPRFEPFVAWGRVGARAVGIEEPRMGIPRSRTVRRSARPDRSRLAADARVMQVLAAEARFHRRAAVHRAHARNSSPIPRDDSSRSSRGARWCVSRRESVQHRLAAPCASASARPERESGLESARRPAALLTRADVDVYGPVTRRASSFHGAAFTRSDRPTVGQAPTSRSIVRDGMRRPASAGCDMLPVTHLRCKGDRP